MNQAMDRYKVGIQEVKGVAFDLLRHYGHGSGSVAGLKAPASGAVESPRLAFGGLTNRLIYW